MLCRPPFVDIFLPAPKTLRFEPHGALKFSLLQGNQKLKKRTRSHSGFVSLDKKMVSPGQAAPIRPEILGLYRALLRAAREFRDYNVREYTKRRAIDGFRENQNLTDPESISSAYAEGKNQLAIAKRQAVVYSLYAPKVKSIMELENPADLIN